MLGKRKLFKKNQLILKLVFITNELKNKLFKSLKKNHYNTYLFRLSFMLIPVIDKCNFSKTLQKLVCPYSLSYKVPNKRFCYSRFFLNKKLNSFNMNNTFK